MITLVPESIFLMFRVLYFVFLGFEKKRTQDNKQTNKQTKQSGCARN